MNIKNTANSSSNDVNNNSDLNLLTMNANVEKIEENTDGTIRILKKPRPRLFPVIAYIVNVKDAIVAPIVITRRELDAL